MSEEEKKAIEKLKSIVKVHNDFMEDIKREFISLEEIKALEIALNLIEKYQKELEQEKEKNQKILSNNIENFRKLFAEEFSKIYISKDKIREFIKEETKEGTYNFKSILAKRLKELLKEE